MGKARGAKIGRREFMGVTAAAAGVTILKPRIVFGSQANSAVRLGLLGCGGRGRSVMGSFLENTRAVLTAIGDLFPDQLESGKAQARRGLGEVRQAGRRPEAPLQGPALLRGALREQGRGRGLHRDPALVPPGAPRGGDRRGQAHLPREAGRGGRSRREEGDGARRARARPASSASRSASRSGTRRPTSSSRSGSTRARSARPSPGRSTTSPPRSAGPTGRRRRRSSDALRNWVHDKALSGDIIVEQNIHIIDVTNWMLKGTPVKAVGLRRPRRPHATRATARATINCVFTYPGDVHISFASTQFGKAGWGVGMQYYGTKGCARGALRRAGPHRGRDQLGVPGPQEARAH